MMNFTEWNNKDEPQGLEGVKKRILNEAPRRKPAARAKVFRDPNIVDPKLAAQAKARAADAAKRAAVAKDRSAGNVDDEFQDAPRQERVAQQKKPLSLKPDTKMGGGDKKPPTKPPVASAPEPEDNDNPQFPGVPSLDDLLGTERGSELRNTLINEPDKEEGQSSIHDFSPNSDMVGRLNGILDDRDSRMSTIRDQILESFDSEKELTGDSLRGRQIIDSLMKGIPDGPDATNLRDKFVSIAARAATFPKSKVRSGDGARSMLREEKQQLASSVVRDTLLKGFGDGNWKQIKTFSDSMKILKNSMSEEQWDEVTDMWMKSQPKEILDRFSGAGDLGGKGKMLHFAGFDENGKKIPGKVGNPSRTKSLVKTFLQQAGLDGYTGMPLRFEHMEPDHIRGFQTIIDGNKPTAEDELNADHPDNWIWTSTGVNNIKSDKTMGDFLNEVGDDQSGMSVRDLLFQDEGVRYLEDDSTDFAKSFVEQFDDEGTSRGVLNESLTREMINERMDQQQLLIKALQDGGASISKSRLLKDIFAASSRIPRENRLNLASQDKDRIRERSQARLDGSPEGTGAMREMFYLMAGKPKEEQARISKNWTSAWESAIGDIVRNFKLYDDANGQGGDSVDWDRDDMVMQDNEDFRKGKSKIAKTIRGGPTLKKLFHKKFLELMGDEGESVASKISWREQFDWLMEDLDLKDIIG